MPCFGGDYLRTQLAAKEAEIAALRAQLEKADALAEMADIIMRIVGDNQPCTFKKAIDAYKEARHG